MVDFTIISSKNVELSRAASFERARTRASGIDRVHIIIFIPTGMPNAKEAMDRAIESVPGAVALLDGVITSKFWYIPYIYGQQWYVVEGTPLIDPKLASVVMDAKYMITRLDSDGKVIESRAVTKEEYDAFKAKMKRVNS